MKPNDQSPPRLNHQNNFDLIRLVAAMQVAVIHLGQHLDYPKVVHPVLSALPGVPIFFFISGYLIHASYSRTLEKGGHFFSNRFLRIYPGLFACFVLSALSVSISGYWHAHNLVPRQYIGWIITQLSCFQFWNPDSLRGYGVGVVNGSLWTISIEVQFYAVIPVIHRLVRHGGWLPKGILVMLVAANALGTHASTRDHLAWKLYMVSLLPWLSMFMLGSMVQQMSGFRTFILARHPLVWLSSYIACHYILGVRLGMGSGNSIAFPSFVLLAFTVLSFAYWSPSLGWKILRGNDLSYGLYIYHMPVANWLIFHGLRGSAELFGLALAISLVLGAASWFLIEKRALALKGKVWWRSRRKPA